jgi:S1-C subfamily serine protease
VVAIGNPLGEDRTITEGIVSAVARQIQSLVPGKIIYGAIQTDAAINHGNHQRNIPVTLGSMR